MPEGPELYLASQFVNESCKNRVFSGKILKSVVSKNPEIPWNAKSYTINATARGKEMRIKLTTCSAADAKSLDIIFRFGMSGTFQFTSVENIHKHAHLRFFTKEKPIHVLSFVDVRRFGRWDVSGKWSSERGPDVMFEYDYFRTNVLENLHLNVFSKPICEVLLNQKYFNGIGNYLRAEILHRTTTPPFVSARSVLEPLQVKKETSEDVREIPDFLEMVNHIPLEVIALDGKGYDPESSAKDYGHFTNWLQCYNKSSMKNIVDHNGRTIWFSGEPGPLAPHKKKQKYQKRFKQEQKTLESNPKEEDKQIEISALTNQSISKERNIRSSRKRIQEIDKKIANKEEKSPPMIRKVGKRRKD